MNIFSAPLSSKKSLSFKTVFTVVWRSTAHHRFGSSKEKSEGEEKR
jgi:hypothetical protein